MTPPFDFDQHRVRSLEAYGAVHDKYVAFAEKIEDILRVILRRIPVHNISARAKELDRFATKAAKPSPENPSQPKYADPLREIEDLAGARVITFVLRTLPLVEEAIHREFEVVERSDKGDQLVEKALVGYRSIHCIVRMRPERIQLPEYRDFEGLRAEIQIRTILQHAWAEIEHDMRYKPTSEPNQTLSQRFTALAGLIEVGDREFDQIYEIDEQRRKKLLDLEQINESIPEPIESLKRKKGSVEFFLPSDLPANNGTPSLKDLTNAQPKDLVAQGKYADAIVKYTSLIENEPKQFSHYLGRAKARFLFGDAEGSMRDLGRSEELNPGHPFIARVRDIIEGRAIEQKRSSEQGLVVRQGHTALRDGDAEEALLKYLEAEKLGFSPVFSIYNRAMARFLEKKYLLSWEIVNRIDPYPGSALELNVATLKVLCYVMSHGENVEGALSYLRDKLEKLNGGPGFQYARSPLADLEQGIKKIFNKQEREPLDQVFRIFYVDVRDK